MGIYYGDIHYGIKISKKVISQCELSVEPICEVIFNDNSISLNDYLYKVANIYLNLLEPEKYRYELLVDITTTYDGVRSDKEWQVITTEQMINFINGSYKIDFLTIEAKRSRN
jgi:hypothetical protein